MKMSDIQSPELDIETITPAKFDEIHGKNLGKRLRIVRYEYAGDTYECVIALPSKAILERYDSSMGSQKLSGIGSDGRPQLDLDISKMTEANSTLALDCVVYPDSSQMAEDRPGIMASIGDRIASLAKGGVVAVAKKPSNASNGHV